MRPKASNISFDEIALVKQDGDRSERGVLDSLTKPIFLALGQLKYLRRARPNRQNF